MYPGKKLLCSFSPRRESITATTRNKQKARLEKIGDGCSPHTEKKKKKKSLTTLSKQATIMASRCMRSLYYYTVDIYILFGGSEVGLCIV